MLGENVFESRSRRWQRMKQILGASWVSVQHSQTVEWIASRYSRYQAVVAKSQMWWWLCVWVLRIHWSFSVNESEWVCVFQLTDTLLPRCHLMGPRSTSKITLDASYFFPMSDRDYFLFILLCSLCSDVVASVPASAPLPRTHFGRFIYFNIISAFLKELRCSHNAHLWHSHFATISLCIYFVFIIEGGITPSLDVTAHDLPRLRQVCHLMLAVYCKYWPNSWLITIANTLVWRHPIHSVHWMTLSAASASIDSTLRMLLVLRARGWVRRGININNMSAFKINYRR